MKNIITATLATLALSTFAYACPGHHHPCSPTECAPAKESANPANDDKKVAQVNAAKPAQNDATVAAKDAPVAGKDAPATVEQK